ncbi:MAG: endonuclease domain-containing protein [Aureispira sp.]
MPLINKLQQLKDNNYYYNPKLKKRAAQLVKNITLPEKKLWEQVLIARKMKGFRFMRQVPVLYYIPDFMCKELALIIEVDGRNHKYQKAYDSKRTQKLEACGFSVLRFSNKEVTHQIEKVQQRIEDWIEKNYTS